MEKTIESIAPIVLLFVSAGLFYAWDILWQKEHSNIKVKKLFCFLILVCFICVFVKITLIGRESSLPRRLWIIPFYSYYKYLSGWQVFLFKQNVQNILLFMPLGFFGCILLQQQKEKKRRRVVIGSGLLLSLTVEITQYVRAIGLLEIDDIIHNTFGTFLGCFLYETICCLRITKTQKCQWVIRFNERSKFIKNMKVIGIIIAVYLSATLVAYVNHLYHVHVLWR